jgi:hypothetical protein
VFKFPRHTSDYNLPRLNQPGRVAEKPRIIYKILNERMTQIALSSSTALSAVNQRLLVGTQPVQEQAGTLWLPLRRPLCLEDSFFATWQDLWLSTMDHLRSEVVGRLLRTLCAQSRQGAFPRLLASRRQVVVVRREQARHLCPPSW